MNLIKAVSEFGCSLIGFHGTADGFRGNVKYNMLTGAQFAGHPLGKMTEYTVITDSRLGVPTFKVVTEQLFLMVSPAAEVLAYSEFKPKSHPYFLSIALVKAAYSIAALVIIMNLSSRVHNYVK